MAGKSYFKMFLELFANVNLIPFSRESLLNYVSQKENHKSLGFLESKMLDRRPICFCIMPYKKIHFQGLKISEKNVIKSLIVEFFKDNLH